MQGKAKIAVLHFLTIGLSSAAASIAGCPRLRYGHRESCYRRQRNLLWRRHCLSRLDRHRSSDLSHHSSDMRGERNRAGEYERHRAAVTGHDIESAGEAAPSFRCGFCLADEPWRPQLSLSVANTHRAKAAATHQVLQKTSSTSPRTVAWRPGTYSSGIVEFGSERRHHHLCLVIAVDKGIELTFPHVRRTRPRVADGIHRVARRYRARLVVDAGSHAIQLVWYALW